LVWFCVVAQVRTFVQPPGESENQKYAKKYDAQRMARTLARLPALSLAGRAARGRAAHSQAIARAQARSIVRLMPCHRP
jgi:hypothetical protein